MPWHILLNTEIAVEFRALTPTMWDAWALHTPTRDEAARSLDARQETARRAAVAGAMGDVRKQRAIESRIRAWKRRKAKR